MNKLTTSTAIPTRALKLEALSNISASFELFCLASGVEALAEMMDQDAQAVCGPRHARGPDRQAQLHHSGIDTVFKQPCRISVPQGVAERIPAAWVAAEKVRVSVPRPTGPVATRVGNSQRGLAWIFQSRRRLNSIGSGSGTSRSLLPLPIMRSSRLLPSTAPISRVAASLIRRPQAYMTAKQVLWTGLVMPPSSRRTSASASAWGSRFWRGRRIFFLRTAPNPN